MNHTISKTDRIDRCREKERDGKRQNGTDRVKDRDKGKLDEETGEKGETEARGRQEG